MGTQNDSDKSVRDLRQVISLIVQAIVQGLWEALYDFVLRLLGLHLHHSWKKGLDNFIAV